MNVKQAFKTAIKSRSILLLMAFTLIQAVILAIMVAIYTHVSGLQVPVHYSAFSSLQFYRDNWVYLVSFAVFGIAVVAINNLIMMRLLTEKGKSIALIFQVLTVVVLALATILMVALLRVAGLQG